IMHTIANGISGKCIIATDFISAGTILFTFDPAYSQNEQTYQTIQVGPNKHCLINSDLALLNHSCNPNLLVETTKGIVYTKKNVYCDEELTYFYPSTEWDMVRPFLCNCGSPACMQFIRGAYWTPLYILLDHYVNKHIADFILTEVKYASDLTTFLD
ncbi:MAG: SET domain-containing protein-lysine N-methyltransferase, partial [Firmicutes bacterium]|nr:SET domain-containing protein-lysine N-methyltransferase [Bacillota bacterium]